MNKDAKQFFGMINAEDEAGIHAFLLERGIDARGMSLQEIIAFAKLFCNFGILFCQGIEQLP